MKSRTISGSKLAASFVPLVLFYGVLVLAFSFLGFVAQQPTVHFHEYSFPEAILELGGHMTFGAMVALPFRQVKACVLGAAFAIVIDADHILGALNLNVSGRPDHSIAFAATGAVAVWLVVRKYPSMGLRQGALATSALVPASVLSHVSYDVLAANEIFNGLGSSFPIYSPFSFSLVPFPTWSWIVLELAGLLFSLMFWGLTRGGEEIP